MLISDVPAYAASHAAPGAAIHFNGHDTTLAQFADRCRQLACALAPLAARGARVAILAANRTEYLECYFGVPAAGMVLNPLNWRLAPRELAYILADAEPELVIVEPEWLATIQALRADAPYIRHVIVLGGAGEVADAGAGALLDYDRLLAGADPAALPAPGHEDDPVWLLYTSGTTGRPKGALLSHRNLLASTANTLMSLSMLHRDVALFMFPMFHVAGYALVCYLLRGCTIVLVRQFDPLGYLQAVQRHRVSNHAFAPTMLAMVLEHPAIDDYDTSSLRFIAYGAAAMPPEILRAALARWPQVGFGTCFGMTELAGNVTYMDPADHLAALAGEPAALVSCGRQMPLAQVRIVDDAGRDMPLERPGEIAVRGDQVFAGYWRNPQATRDAFVDGWFRTGDVGRRDALGRFFVVDRKKDMILTGGENVYSREVEDLLYEHPGVAEAAVVGSPDVKWGELVTAVIRLKTGATADAGALDEFCRARIAGYKRPRRWLFVAELPKSAAGKILKAELRAQLRDGRLATDKPNI